MAKLAAAEQAALHVAEWQNYMDRLASIHRESSPVIDWHSHTQPYVDRSRSTAAREAHKHFRPTLLDKVLGPEKARRSLEKALHTALAREAEAERESIETARLAQAVLNWDRDAMLHVIKETGCLAELVEMGTSPSGDFPRPGIVESTLHAGDQSVVPAQQLSLTKAGKLSSRKMPAKLRSETYAAYLCGAAVRTARELLSTLPLDGALVHVQRLILNKATGHPEPKHILSFYCPRARVLESNFDYVDAYDFVVALGQHRIALKRNTFAPIDPIRWQEIGASGFG